MAGSNLVSGSLLLCALCIGMLGCNDTQKQRDMAIDATRQLQQQYNDRTCKQIYEDASSYFHRHEPLEQWLADCQEMRRRFGEWRDFTPEMSNDYPFGRVGVVWVSGPARFDTGTVRMRVDWDLAQGRAALFNVQIEHNNERSSIPGFSGRVRGR